MMKKISKNLRSYCKNTFEKDDVIKLVFDKASCENYFFNVRSTCAFPNWMNQLPEPTAIFDQSFIKRSTKLLAKSNLVAHSTHVTI